MSKDIAITVNNLSKHFTLRCPIRDQQGNLINKLWALKNVNLELKKGESIGIIGANGSGKSTLLKILSGIVKPSEGYAEVYGKVASVLDIGTGFHSELSGRENIFINAKLHGFSTEEVNQNIDKIIAFSGIEPFIDEPIKTYSNGMYIRLAFSIIATLNFDVYLLDEVMGVGDLDFQTKAKDVIEKKLQQKSAAFIFVSHNINALRYTCQKIYWLHEGEIKESGTTHILDQYIEKQSLKSAKVLPINIANETQLELQNEWLTIQSFRAGESENALIENQEIKLITKILVKQRAKFDIAFFIETLSGEKLCYVSTLLNEVNGTNTLNKDECIFASAVIPSYVLKPGKYYVSVTIIVNDTTPVITYEKMIIMDIKSTNHNNKLITERPQTPLISTKWSVKNTSILTNGNEH